MTRRTRRAIFYVLTALFLLIGTTVVLYAEGWRFDFGTFRAEKVGAIYLRSFPSDASITLDGKPVQNQSGFLSKGTLISNLFPRTYSVALGKDGYLPWRENAAVTPALVTALKNAVLIPAVPASVSTGTVKNYFAGGGAVIVQTPANAIRWQGKTIAHGTLIDAGANLEDALVRDATTGAATLYRFENSADNAGVAPTAVSVPIPFAARAAIDPANALQIFALDASHAFLFDASRATTTVIAAAPAGVVFGSAFAIAPSAIAWTRYAEKTGALSLVIYDRAAQTVTRSSSTIPGTAAEVRWIGTDAVAVLQHDGTLWRYDVNGESFTKLDDGVRSFAVADDGSALGALGARSLDLFPFTDAMTYGRFNIPDVPEAQGLLWYGDRTHLFVVYPDRVVFLDLMDFGLRNFTAVATGTLPLYNPSDNTFYLVNSLGKLARFDFPR